MQKSGALVMVPVRFPFDMWQAFADAIGPEKLRDAYGWTTVPRMPRDRERVYGFWHREAVAKTFGVGWGSLWSHPLEPGEYWLSLGVMPEYSGRGYRLDMRNMLVAEAFENLKATHVNRCILGSNPLHYRRIIREMERGETGWKDAGRVWLPKPGYMISTIMREDWQ